MSKHSIKIKMIGKNTIVDSDNNWYNLIVGLVLIGIEISLYIMDVYL